MRAGSALNTVPLVWNRKAFGAGFSKFAIARSAPWSSARMAPPLPVRFVRGNSQPNDEQQ
jgi:hypothetical protein